MASTGSPVPRAFFAASTLLLALVLVLTVWGLLHPPPAAQESECRGECVEQQEAEARWEALWSAINAAGEDALAPVTDERSLRAAGDTAYMRYRNLWDEVDQTVRHTFQMAALANTPERKLALLEPLVQNSDPQVRFRALLEIARIRLRLRELDQAQQSARRALAISEVAPGIAADAHFILGYAALQARDLETAEAELARAVADDPGFWDARQTQLLVLSRQLGQRRQRPARCLDRTRLLIENLGAMPALAQNRMQFRDIADYFGTRTEAGNPAFYLLAGLGYRWAGDEDKSRRALRQAKQSQDRLPPRCEGLIMEKVDQLLAGSG